MMIFFFFQTYTESCNFFLIVLRSMGVFMIFLYVGNCLVLTGSRNGQASSCCSSCSRRVLQGASSRCCFLVRLLLTAAVAAAAVAALQLTSFLGDAVGVGGSDELTESSTCAAAFEAVDGVGLIDNTTGYLELVIIGHAVSTQQEQRKRPASKSYVYGNNNNNNNAYDWS